MSGQSFSGNYYPSSQFQKISIGVTAEETPRVKSQVRKADEAVFPAKEKKTSSQEKFGEEHSAGIKAAFNEAEAAAPYQGNSASASTQSFHQETEPAKAAQFCANLQSGQNIYRKFGSVEKMKEDGGNTEMVKEFPSTNKQEMHDLDKEDGKKLDDRSAKGGTEALRMKLWEILGTAPSQNDQNSHSQTGRTGMENLETQRNGDQKDEVVKSKQNSDPIETDSESPNQTIRRPITRSLTRRKAPTKLKPKVRREINNNGGFEPSSSSRFKPKCQEKNIFSFDEAEARAGRMPWPPNGSSLLSRRRKGEKTHARTEQANHFFPKEVSSKSLQATEREKVSLPPPEKTTTKSERMKEFHGLSQENKHPLQPRNFLLHDDFHCLPVTKKSDPQENRSSLSPKDADQPESFVSSPVRKNTDSVKKAECLPKNAHLQKAFGSSLPTETDPQINFKNPIFAMHIETSPQIHIQSPTFARDTPIENDFPSPLLPKNTPEGAFHSPALAEREFMIDGFHNIQTMNTPRQGSSGSDIHMESSDDAREFTKSSTEESSPVMKKRLTGKRLALSSREEQDSESSDSDDITDKGFRTKERGSSGTVSPERTSFMPGCKKRLGSEDSPKSSDLDRTSTTPKGTQKSYGHQEVLEQDQENGLARAVAQFALVLERFKNKMKFQTSKRKSEILASVAETVHSQLQSVESQIQMGLAKFTSLSNSKRKRLESRFQEQEERLKLIHDKFKEEVNRHFHHCQSTLEELEAHQIELEGKAEKQKALHKQLLLQVEEAIQIQLSDAERSVTAIHKASRTKMEGLKHLLMKCLSEFAHS